MNARRFAILPMVAMLASAFVVCLSHAQTPSDKATVKGTFLGDGKDGKIQYLVVQTREPFSDKPAIQLVFTEKNPASSKKPDFDAGFKKLGSALILSVFKDGDIFGCEVAHTAHPKSPFSSLGTIKMIEFKVTDTNVSGHVSTGGEADAFGQKWNVDLTFAAPLPKGAFAASSESPADPEKSGSKKASKEEGEPAAAEPKVPVGKLPLPAAAREVEYKSLVEQIAFRADASVIAVANDFAAKLKQQGWKESPGSLVGKSSAILKRKLDGADLTIMIQPEGKGCTAKIFAQGLDWSDAPASNTGAAKPAKGGDAESIEAEANRLLNDALKQIPRGLKK